MPKIADRVSKRIHELSRAGWPRGVIARRLCVSLRTLERWSIRLKKHPRYMGKTS